jgi:hypothetical protein
MAGPNVPDGGFVYTAPDGTQHVVQGNTYVGPVDGGPSDAGALPALGPSDAGMPQPGPSDAGATFQAQPPPSGPGMSPEGGTPGPSDGGVPAPGGADAAGGMPSPDPYAAPSATGAPPAKPVRAVGTDASGGTIYEMSDGSQSTIQAPISNRPWVQRADGTFGPAEAPPAAPAPQPAPATPAAPGKVAAANGTGGMARPSTSAYDKATQQRGQAEKDAAAARAASSTAVGEEYGKQSQALKETEDAWQQHLKTQLQAGQARLKELDDLASGGKSEKLDPDRWWKSRSEGQKVMGTIALALGGFATAFGGENTGAKLIGDAIARDVDAQRFNITQAAQDRRDKLAGKSTAFGHFMQLLGDERAAHDATMAYQLKQGALRVEQMTAAMKAPEEVAKGKAIAAQLNQEAEDHKLKAAETFSNLQTQALQRDHTRFQMAMEKRQMEYLQNPNRAALPTEAVGPGGRFYNVGDKEVAKELDTSRRLGKGGIEALHALSESTNGFTSPVDPAKRGQYEAAKAKLATVWNGLEGVPSVVGESERKEIDDMLHNGVFTPGSKLAATFKTIEKGIRANVGQTWARVPGVDPLADVAQLPTQAQRDALASAGVR